MKYFAIESSRCPQSHSHEENGFIQPCVHPGLVSVSEGKAPTARMLSESRASWGFSKDASFIVCIVPSSIVYTFPAVIIKHDFWQSRSTPGSVVSARLSQESIMFLFFSFASVSFFQMLARAQVYAFSGTLDFSLLP